MPLPNSVWRLGLISFFADIASEMAYPVLPLFLRSLGAPAAALGIIEGLADATASILKGVSGKWSDASARRLPFVRWGYLLSALGKPLIGFATGWPTVTASRVLDRFGKGIRTTARDALLAEEAPKGSLGAVFGLHRAMDTAGALVGVLVALLLLSLLPGQYRTIFFLAAIPGAISVALALRLREPVRRNPPDPADRPVANLKLSSFLKKLLLLHGMFAIANTSDTFLLVYAKEQYGLSEVMVIAAYLMYNITYTAFSLPAGRLSDRVGRWPVLLTGWMMYGLVYAGFAFAGQAWVWPLFLCYGLYVAFTQGVAKAQIAEMAPKSQKGSVLGRFYLITGICTLIGNGAFGVVWDRFGAKVALLGAASLALSSFILAILMRLPSSAETSEVAR